MVELKVIEGGKMQVFSKYENVLEAEDADALEKYVVENELMHAANENIRWNYVPFSRHINPNIKWEGADRADNTGMFISPIRDYSETFPYVSKILGDKLSDLKEVYPYGKSALLQQIAYSNFEKTGYVKPHFSPRTTLKYDFDYVTLYYFINDTDGAELVVFNEKFTDKEVYEFTAKEVIPCKKNTAYAFYGHHFHTFVRPKSGSAKYIQILLTAEDYEKTGG